MRIQHMNVVVSLLFSCIYIRTFLDHIHTYEERERGRERECVCVRKDTRTPLSSSSSSSLSDFHFLLRVV